MNMIQRLAAFDLFFENVHRRIVHEVIQPSRHFKVLDVGCGAGGMTILLADAVSGGIVVALDSDDRHLRSTRDKARELELRSRIVCILGDVEKLQFMAGEFDVVWCSRVIHHHLPNPQVGLSEMYRVLKPGGRLFLRESMNSEFMSVSLATDNDRELWQRLGSAQQQWFQSKFRHRRPGKEEWLECMTASGFSECHGVTIPYSRVKARGQLTYLKGWLEGVLDDHDSPHDGDLLGTKDVFATRELIARIEDLLLQSDDALERTDLQVQAPTDICVGLK